ncbi:hypothetical protein M1349_05040 [Patescibacteria group bacterium]|nr:hypothetical protein [Patescibacteria group bacterium]
MKKLFVILIMGLITALLQKPVYAEISSTKATSARIAMVIPETREDHRVKILKDFLKAQDSPLAEYADVFVRNADKYNLDWKLVAAISGTESSFGLAYPNGTYNGWGWGIYGNNMHYFTSWEDGIETISKGLREQYMDKWGAQDVYGIGKFYASSPTWAEHTIHFMNRIDEFALRNPENTLSLSL